VGRGCVCVGCMRVRVWLCGVCVLGLCGVWGVWCMCVVGVCVGRVCYFVWIVCVWVCDWVYMWGVGVCVACMFGCVYGVCV